MRGSKNSRPTASRLTQLGDRLWRWRLAARLIQSTVGYGPASATRRVDCLWVAVLSAFIADRCAAVVVRERAARRRLDDMHLRARR
jgi:hypothetical protein